MKEDKFKKILKSDLEIPKQVEDKMQEAYRMIGADEEVKNPDIVMNGQGLQLLRF